MSKQVDINTLTEALTDQLKYRGLISTDEYEHGATVIRNSLNHHLVDLHTCPSCNGRHWFIVLNDDDAGNHIERCDSCKVFRNDEDAADYAVRSEQVVFDGDMYRYSIKGSTHE
jgi:hypothetical protein